MDLKTYDPSQVSLAIGGALIEFDEVAIEQEEDDNTLSAGTQGEVTRTKNLNKIALWTVTLPQTSSGNDVLSTLRLTNAAFVAGLLDIEGTTVVSAPEAVITKGPPVSRGKESGQNAWQIKGKTEFFVGGNS